MPANIAGIPNVPITVAIKKKNVSNEVIDSNKPNRLRGEVFGCVAIK
jgi:hypothetical protein